MLLTTGRPDAALYAWRLARAHAAVDIVWGQGRGRDDVGCADADVGNGREGGRRVEEGEEEYGKGGRRGGGGEWRG